MSNVILLTSIMLAPSLVGTLFVYFIGKKLLPSKDKELLGQLKGDKWASLKVVFKPHPDTNLLEQPSFILALVLPVIYFLTLGFISWHGSKIDLSHQGFSMFIAISKLPIAVLALSIPFAAVAARLHSSEQKAVQIKQAERKNNFDLYYSHLDKFIYQMENRLNVPEYIQELLASHEKKVFITITYLYRCLFPNSNQVNGPSFDLDSTILKGSEVAIIRFDHALKLYANSPSIDDANKNYQKLYQAAITAMSDIGLANIYLSHEPIGVYELTTHGNTSQSTFWDIGMAEWVKTLEFCIHVHATILAFSGIKFAGITVESHSVGFQAENPHVVAFEARCHSNLNG